MSVFYVNTSNITTMLRIDRISVSNYKNLSVDELELRNFNVIVGPNNSGKSNFIQIFSFLNYIINGPLDQIKKDFNTGLILGVGIIIPSINRSKKGEINIGIKFSNTITDIQYHYNITLEWNSPDENIWARKLSIKEEVLEFKEIHKTGPPTSIFTRRTNKVTFNKSLKKDIGIDTLPEDVSVINLLKVVSQESRNQEINEALKLLDSILKTETIYFSNIELTKSEKTRTYKYGGRTVAFDFVKEIVNISKNEGLFDFFKETLRNILKIETVKIFEFSPGETENDSNKTEYFIFFDHLGSSKAIWDFSDGTVLLIALITKILVSETDIFLIEEPENSLHPQALVDLISFFRSFEENKQFIIASHSIAIINKVKPEDVIIAQCQGDGKSNLKRVENSAELRKTLKQGFIAFSDLLFFDQDEIE